MSRSHQTVETFLKFSNVITSWRGIRTFLDSQFGPLGMRQWSSLCRFCNMNFKRIYYIVSEHTVVFQILMTRFSMNFDSFQHGLDWSAPLENHRKPMWAWPQYSDVQWLDCVSRMLTHPTYSNQPYVWMWCYRTAWTRWGRAMLWSFWVASDLGASTW